MPSDRVSKKYRSSTERRHTAAAKIKLLVFELLEMGRCTPCQVANTQCFVLKGRKRCSACESKNNNRCDGNFSEVEFDSLEAKKRQCQEEARSKRAEVGRRAAAAAQAYAELAQAQQEEVDLQKKIDGYTESQSRMLRQELDALDRLNEMPEDAWVGSAGPALPWGDFTSPGFSGDFSDLVTTDGFGGSRL